MAGYRAGKFPDGSVLVDERNQAEEKEGKTIAGAYMGIGVMVKDQQRYPETGGWGFEIFSGNDRTNGLLTAQVRQACYDCHAKQSDHDYVFSNLRD